MRSAARVLGCILLCGSGFFHQASGQEEKSSPVWNALESTIPALPMLQTIVEAEREGMSFPRLPAPENLERYMGQIAGSPDRRCARPDPALTAFRTGDFAMGAEINQVSAGRHAKIWMAPQHDPAPDRNALLVRAARLIDGQVASQDTVRIVSLAYGRPVGRPNSTFFPMRTFMLPEPGDWLVVATAGSDWGCLIMTVR